jgi:hypothetical protein
VLLDLNTNKLGDANVLHITSLLEKNTVLEELEVGSNKFTTKAYQIMGNALEENPELAAKLDFFRPQSNILNAQKKT